MTEFTLRVPHYNEVDHLHGTMVEFGEFVLKYKPPKGSQEAKLKMTISSEASRSDMVAFFDDFLLSAGYPPPEDKAVSCEKHWDDFWEGVNDEARDNN